MSNPNDLPLDWFKREQLAKLSLAKNVSKPHWLEMEETELYDRLEEEVLELRRAIEEYEDDGASGAVVSECLDVANFAAMIAHKVMGPLNREFAKTERERR